MTEPTSSQSIQESAQALAQEALNEQMPKKIGCRKGCVSAITYLLIFIIIVYSCLYSIFGISVLPSIDIKQKTWEEEVQLSDGSVALVRRKVLGEGSVYWHTSFFVQDAEFLEVLDTKGTPPPKFLTMWNTLLLDRTADGQWIAVVTQNGYSMDWNSCFAYKQYAVVDGQWQQVRFDTSLKGRKSNLTWGYGEDLYRLPKLIKLSEKPFGESGPWLGVDKSYYEMTPDIFRCKEDDFGIRSE